MDIKLQTITPKLAEKLLNSNNCNRSLREGIVEKYADDMATGRWTQCAVPICIYDDGEIADGQHRLYAIIESQKPQTFIVATGLSKSDGLNIDTGLNRSLVDNAKISGVHASLSHNLISVCRAIENGKRQPEKSSNSRKLDEVMWHEEAARWAMAAMGTKRGLTNAVSIGAVGRAYYHESDKSRLEHFCKTYTSGFMNGTEDSSAIAMRNYILDGGYGLMSTGPGWVDTFKKIQNAIYYFMREKQLKVIKNVADERYPLLKRKK